MNPKDHTHFIKTEAKKLGFLSKINRPSRFASLKSLNSKCSKNVFSIENLNSCFPSFSPTKGRVNSFNTSIAHQLSGKFINFFDVTA